MERLDVYLVANGYYESRAKAQQEIKNGCVFIDGNCVQKNNFLVNEFNKIEIKNSQNRYVSRAGLKLEKAQEVFKIDFSGKTILDIGASTGGFSDVCLKGGAKLVYAVDVGTSQLHSKIKNDSRVINMEKTDIRNVAVSSLKKIDCIVCDVSFISLELIIPKIAEILDSEKVAIVLIKPQFECGPKIARACHGVVKDKKIQTECVEKIVNAFFKNGFECRGISDSPILGGDGNEEFLSYFVKNKKYLMDKQKYI